MIKKKKPKKKTKLKKVESTKTLKRKAKELFALYIKLKHAVGGKCKCVTCGEWLELGDRDLHAGHFMHGSQKKLCFDERNVFPQCNACNYFRSGMKIEYTIYIEDMYGREGLEEIIKEGSKTKIWNKTELRAIIEEYSTKIKQMQGG